MNKKRVVSRYIAARDHAWRNGESVHGITLAPDAGNYAKRIATICEVLNQDESSESLVNSAA